jgi:tetratricopeptide (TPR) repeat protein
MSKRRTNARIAHDGLQRNAWFGICSLQRVMRSGTVLLLALTAWSAHGAPVKLRRDAVAHHAAANRAFRAGDYEAALEHLQAGYESEPRPEFLVAFAQAYRELGRIDDAIAHCQRYLELAPRGPLAEQVRSLARELRDRVKHDPPAVKADFVEAWQEAKPEPKPEPKPVLEAMPARPGHEDTGRVRRRDLTLGLVLSAAGVIVGLGVGLGVGLAQDPAAPPTRFGTISFQ